MQRIYDVPFNKILHLIDETKRVVVGNHPPTNLNSPSCNKSEGKILQAYDPATGGEKMNSEILVALFSLIGTAMGTFGGIKLTNYRIEQLEKKVDKHNNLVERTAVIENTIKVHNHRISDLESERKE